jgi:hypothetical protein
VSVDQAPSQDPEVATIVRALKLAVQDLPIERQDVAFEQMGAALVETERTGDPGPVSRYVSSLRLTARLHRNPAYIKALREANDDLAEEMAQAVPVGTFVAQMRARHA